MSTLTVNPVTLEPMTPRMKTVYRIGFYDADGALVKHQEGWPAEDNATPQMVADISAASHQPSMGAGTVVVWEDVDTEPVGHLSSLFGEDWTWCHFGPDAEPIPHYRIEVGPAGDVTAVLTAPDNV
jgi:hypothetical protein